jgi:di/tricarboxylate transporter
MSASILVVFALVLVAIVLFAWERVPFDVTAVIIMVTLMLSGILTPEEGLAGLSNAATVTIGAMFILSEGLRRTGVLSIVGDYFAQLAQRNYWGAVAAMMSVIGVISAFINNTAAVAIFIPVVIGVAADLDVSASKLLMPLSFASMFGGVCTLIGTSTNILVSSIAEKNGLEGFSMFEFTPLGGSSLRSASRTFFWPAFG